MMEYNEGRSTMNNKRKGDNLAMQIELSLKGAVYLCPTTILAHFISFEAITYKSTIYFHMESK